MPRKAHLAKYYSSDELKQKYIKSQERVEARRWHLLWKISLGWTIKNSAIAVGINYEYGKEIVKKYNNLGEKEVVNLKKNPRKHTGGKKSLLTEKQLEKLAAKLESRPSDGGIWTGTKVARWLEEETGVEKVWNQRGWDYLKKLKYSWQSPRAKHHKADQLAQVAFKQNLPLKVFELKEKYPEAQIDVWFFDEHRVGLKPIIRKVWARIGSRPIAVVKPGYEWLYVYGFVKPLTGETLWYLVPRVNTKWLTLVYESFAIDAGLSQDRMLLLVQDNAGWHRSQKVKIPVGITLEFLPPYSPELQPAERLWNLVDEPLVNRHFETINEIEELLIKRCNVLSKMKQEIKNLTNYHWLNYQ